MYLLSHTWASLKMPDGRRWTVRNLNIPILGYRNPEATKEEGRLYKFLHVQVINFLLWLFQTGWHVPTDAEWSALEEAIGPDAGMKLKSKTGWKYDGNGTDGYGFRALPAGYRDSNDPAFYNRGVEAILWSSSAVSATDAWRRNLYYGQAGVYRTANARSSGFSVRLIKNKKRA
jgi:uncharacterized protein (TIGR02145 family)